ncbi:MAG: VanZ family protein [Clostridia bacterium]|nr:VanZ family protein [Clostridia bacterium]
MRNKLQRLKFQRIFSIVLCVLCVAFIFSNSLDDAARSSDKSGAVVAILQGIADVFFDDVTVSENIVRTVAHFAEFALLGFCLIFAVKTFTQRYIQNIFVAFFTALAVAVVDEILQLFSDGRAADVIDVVVDFSGAVAGMVFFVFVVNLPNIIKNIKAVCRRRKDNGKQK